MVQRIHGVFAMCDSGDVKHGYGSGNVVAGMVAEQAFVAQRFGQVNVAFDDEVGVGGGLRGRSSRTSRVRRISCGR